MFLVINADGELNLTSRPEKDDLEYWYIPRRQRISSPEEIARQAERFAYQARLVADGDSISNRITFETIERWLHRLPQK